LVILRSIQPNEATGSAGTGPALAVTVKLGPPTNAKQTITI
jgi:hypothetical protein